MLGKESKSSLTQCDHEHVEITSVVDLVWAHAPFFALKNDTRNSCTLSNRQQRITASIVLLYILSFITDVVTALAGWQAWTTCIGSGHC